MRKRSSGNRGTGLRWREVKSVPAKAEFAGADRRKPIFFRPKRFFSWKEMGAESGFGSGFAERCVAWRGSFSSWININNVTLHSENIGTCVPFNSNFIFIIFYPIFLLKVFRKSIELRLLKLYKNDIDTDFVFLTF